MKEEGDDNILLPGEHVFSSPCHSLSLHINSHDTLLLLQITVAWSLFLLKCVSCGKFGFAHPTAEYIHKMVIKYLINNSDNVLIKIAACLI